LLEIITKVVCRYRHKRKRLLFISTQFAIHAFAGSPFPVACAQRLLAGWWFAGHMNAKHKTLNASRPNFSHSSAL
jgi:hypothetical protein